jgi:hypothetical protein
MASIEGQTKLPPNGGWEACFDHTNNALTLINAGRASINAILRDKTLPPVPQGFD